MNKDITSFSKINIFLLGLSGWIIFAGIESLQCIFFAGKYWNYYVLLITFWMIIGLVGYFPIFAMCIFFGKTYTRFIRHKKLINESRLLLTFLSLAPLFFYTIIQLNYHLPGKYFSISNLGMDVFGLIIFSFGCYYLYNIWKNQPKKYIFQDYLLVLFLFGGISISGVFLVASELQREDWMLKFCMVFLFCLILPFLFLVILYLKRHLSSLKKLILVCGFLIFIFFIDLHVFCPIVNNFAFRQNDINNKSRIKFLEDSPNIILIVMDTTRAPNMSLYGYERNTTPNLERFARDSVTFTNSISSAPWTLPSHASLFTGHFSYIHGATHGSTVDIHALPLQKSNITLAELMSLNGYDTGAVVANQGYLGPWTGLNQGFSYYWWGRTRDDVLLFSILGPTFLDSKFYNYLERICGIKKINLSKRINQIAINWLKKVRKRPFFLFINYMETHGVNYLPYPYSGIFTSPPAPSWPLRIEKTEYLILTDVNLERIRSWYDNELVFLDNQIGLFLSSLKDMNLYDESIIVITSDHGELMGEHDGFGHEFWLYNELLHVPLIVKYPYGKNKGKIIDKAVQNIDIFAELINLGDINAPSNIQGQPFSEVNHPIISEVKRIPSSAIRWPNKYNRDIKSIFSKLFPNFKLIQYSDGQKELYNVISDPREFNNIQDYQKEKLIQEELKKYLKSLDNLKRNMKINEPKKKKLDKAAKNRLRALGYIK